MVPLKDYKKSNTKENLKSAANKPIDDLFYTIKKSFERRALMACAIGVRENLCQTKVLSKTSLIVFTSIKAKTNYDIEKKLECGLIIGHGKTLLSVL
jgi:hypothetical protein